jgi:hypothetical protein
MPCVEIALSAPEVTHPAKAIASYTQTPRLANVWSSLASTLQSMVGLAQKRDPFSEAK